MIESGANSQPRSDDGAHLGRRGLLWLVALGPRACPCLSSAANRHKQAGPRISMWSALTTGGGCCILVADTPVKGGNAAGAEVDHLASQGLEHDVALAVAPGRPSRSATAWY